MFKIKLSKWSFYLLLSWLFVSCAQDRSDDQKKGVQIIELDQGWNLISFYVQPQPFDSISNVLKPIQQYLTQAEGSTGFRDGMYNPSRGINSLEVVKTNYSYAMKFKEASKLIVEGEYQFVDTILMDSKIRNEVGHYNSFFTVPGKNNVLVTDLEFSHPNQLVLVHEMRGGTYWPENNINTLGVLRPGKSYFFIFRHKGWMAVKAETPLRNWTPESISIYPSNLPKSWRISNYNPFFYLLLVPNDLLKNKQDGDYLAAITENGFCAGLQALDLEETYTLMLIYSDDYLADSPDGFRGGERISLAHFSAKNGHIQKYSFTVERYPKQNAVFRDWNLDRVLKLKKKK